MVYQYELAVEPLLSPTDTASSSQVNSSQTIFEPANSTLEQLTAYQPRLEDLDKAIVHYGHSPPNRR
ncbi:MAG: hypothetical protein AAF974_08675 [Cyanobacteria bacterium P01_E01_bin.34]